MDVPFTGTKEGIREYNLRKYKGRPPSWELVYDVIQRSGIKYIMIFQRIYGIPARILFKYRAGVRGLPPRYWHIFYEFDHLDEYLSSIPSVSTAPRKSAVPQPETRRVAPKIISSAPVKIISEQNKTRLNEFRQRLTQ